jgi:hypothetical protein
MHQSKRRGAGDDQEPRPDQRSIGFDQRPVAVEEEGAVNQPLRIDGKDGIGQTRIRNRSGAY